MTTPRSAALLLAGLALAACASPRWYGQAAHGQYELLRGREDVTAYLAAAPAEDATAARLRVAGEVLDFAAAQLDLPQGGAYRSFVRTGREAVAWNVVATPELSLEPKRWCHLVGGCLPYLGWFSHQGAERQAQRYAERGMDTAVSAVGAYSTLGWFDDPLLDTMLARTDAALAAVLVHELAHRRLFVRGDAAFSEAFASFVEDAGTRAWLSASGRAAEARDWAARRAAQRQFTALLLDARQRLAAVYAGGKDAAGQRAAKQEAFARLRADYDALVRREWNGEDRFAGWWTPPPNNADLALAATYADGQCAFQALFDGLDGDFRRFNAAVARLAQDDPETRAAWLAQPCPDRRP